MMNQKKENNVKEITLTEEEANKRLKEAVHQISKAVCLLKIARESIDYVADTMEWDIDALYDVDEGIKYLGFSLANMETLDTDLGYINDF
jgi:hypothetical protein